MRAPVSLIIQSLRKRIHVLTPPSEEQGKRVTVGKPTSCPPPHPGFISVSCSLCLNISLAFLSTERPQGPFPQNGKPLLLMDSHRGVRGARRGNRIMLFQQHGQ